ncbi:alginate lyase family protein [Dyadobacter soli]|uniref:alginate lyase family protein n=1 Tax=Dyadobacter soli TaxID=659014 RepID=UPI001E59F325|nr:alginate lyase family protein [Dyadobacter soli]
MRRNESLDSLEWRVLQIRAGRFRYFSSQWFEMADWHTNPITGYRYDVNEHWSQVNDFSVKAGDIKYVWEKSRFTFLYDLIRYDYHFWEDQSEMVFELMTDWIDKNPVNCGPNWKCSQEIALRVLNWTFALHYYRLSGTLNQALLDKILCSIYDQMRHVAGNIRFSEIAVRNNHILTEALGLFATGTIFPCFPTSGRWKKQGKHLFEREIVSQITSDGTYLQFSMNYHRLVVQLMTCGIRLAKLQHSPMCEGVYTRARASLTFLRTCQNDENGHLPNYGNNDGALFFPLTECSFRDFRPQLAALANVLGVDLGYQTGDWTEELLWLTGDRNADASTLEPTIKPLSVFEKGGYHVIRDSNTITFLRCGKYYSRPFQADNNHLDIWIDGRNILRDAGTWLYNADDESMRYFSGTSAHNTVMIDDFDQMQKQHRFIWTHWIKNAKGAAGISGDEFWIEAEFEGFRHVGKGIVHKRRVVKKVGQPHWTIEDRVLNVPRGMRIRQLWHPDKAFLRDFQISAVDECGEEIPMTVKKGWYSKVYGEKVECNALVFETAECYVQTVIKAY